MVFAWVTQYDDELLGALSLEYKGEFNILRKAMREIIADLQSNPVQVDFETDSDDVDKAEFMDGKYRATTRENVSIEAFENADQEAVVCGVGAWRLKTEYKSMRNGDTKQVIKRCPIYEANSTVLWGCDSKLLDKSDATRCTILSPYSEDGYKAFAANIKGIDDDDVELPGSMAIPEKGFDWFVQSDKTIYVAEFYHKTEVDDKYLIFEDIFGERYEFLKSKMTDENMDEMEEYGADIVEEKDIRRPMVMLYICSEAEILESYEVPCDHIPVVAEYGERAYVDGEEWYEGIVRLAKDPSRLRNFIFSYVATIASRSPRRKPIFAPEQIAGFESMYEESGADNNYPYLLGNLKDHTGQPLPVGPIAEMPEQPIPTAVGALIDMTRQAVDDVAKSGAPGDISDPDLSGKAIVALQNKIELQSMVYQTHRKHARRRDAVIFASMASYIYDSPRRENIELPDGTKKMVDVMEESVTDSGEFKTKHDITGCEFDIYADIGPGYASKKEQLREQLIALIGQIPEGNPLKEIYMLKLTMIMDGVDMSDVRDYARKQLVLIGVKEPETDKEIAALQAQQQGSQQPDPNLLLAQGKYMEGQAALLREQREVEKTKSDIMVDQASTMIDQFEAETSRLNVQVGAAKANAELNLKRIDTFGRVINQRLRGTS